MRKGFFYIVLLFLLNTLHSQGQNISGVINSYYKVDSVFTSYVKMADTLGFSNLHPGDKAVLMQMTGVTVPPFPPTEQNLSYAGFADAGRYEMLAVKSVNNTTKRVEFTVNLNTANYTNGEKIQLIKIYEADYATVTGTLTADDWDGNKGGVLALVIYKKLTLNVNIDVSYKGFRGGDPEPDYPGTCRALQDTFFFPSTTLRIAGRKGEGNIGTAWAIYTKGPGRVVTGGGGGLGYFAGAGGGSHYGVGGQGGIQGMGCPGSSTWWANGGLTLRDKSFYGYDRVTMGGGGGSSTEDASHTASKGGDGGGIIILLVDTLSGTGSLRSWGEPAAGTATAGGGGGGAGGSILLDVNVYASAKNCSVRGGNGGSTSVNTGAGGGGSGGVIWYAGSAKPGNIVADTVRGTRGTCANTTYNGGNGGSGGTLNKLHLPLNGFLFNSIDGADIICAGQQPRMIKGSMPKGGASSYTYNWLQSTDGNNWEAAQGTGDSLHFQPNALTNTAYYTREVISGAVRDTALMIEVYVYPVITGNTLAIRDTLCSGNSPGTLTGGSLSGGDDPNFTYKWESRTDIDGWSPKAYDSEFVEGTLSQTTYYWRIVTSAAVCVDTSNIDTLTVLPSITNNNFQLNPPYNAVCLDADAGTINALQPLGGDNSYAYQWLKRSDNTPYSEMVGETGQDYIAGTPDSTYYYKRIVYSGEGDACIDTISDPFKIMVYPKITNNFIETDSTRYCAGDIISQVTGYTPDGGNDPAYTYQWLQRTPGSDWSLIAGESSINYAPSEIVTDTLHIRRIVISGDFNACIDSGNYIQLDVIPFINNELVSEDSAICEGAVPLPFTETVASGGAGVMAGYTYQWQSKPATGGSWQPASGTNDVPSYSSDELTTSTQFRRAVTSEICTDNSDPVTITVYDRIEYNTIGSSVQYTCFNASKVITGRTIVGGKPGDARYNWQQSVLGTSSDWAQAAGTNTTKSYTSNPLTDTMFFRRIVLSGEYNQCLDTSSAVLIRINPLPSGDIVSSVDSVCSGSNLTVNYENLFGNSPWTIVLGDDSELYTELGITSATGTISFPVTVSAQIRMLDLIDDSLCHADLSGNNGMIGLTVFEIPVANAGADTEVCGPEASLAAIPSIGKGTWSGTGVTFNNDTLPTTGVTACAYGTYSFNWTEMNWQCESTDEVEVTFYEQPAVPFAGNDQLLDYTFSTTLDAEPPDVGNGYWQFTQGEGTITDPTLYNSEVVFPFPGTGDYTLLWTVVNGICPAVSDDVLITIGDVEIFHGFSPNGDQVNDTFLINLSGQVDCELIILDRWGNQVRKLSNTGRITWGGENDNKQPVPEGTYFYIFRQLGFGIKDETGFIELRR